MERKDIEETLIKAGEVIYATDKPVTLKDIQEFLGGLTEVLGDAVGSNVSSEVTKASMVGIGAYLEGLAKLSDAELASWVRRGATINPAKEFNDDFNISEGNRMFRPSSPDAGWGSSPPSSSPSLPANKAVKEFLDLMANASPADIEKAKTGLMQLESGFVKESKMDDPEFEEAFTKALADTEFKAAVAEALGYGSGDDRVELDLYQGNINSETELMTDSELRKSIVLNSASLMERVAKLRDADLAKRVNLTDNPEDGDWEADARQGRG